MAGIYIHIPFCKKKCSYCDFHFSTSLSNKDNLINSLISEIELQKNYLKGEVINTIYFGGGTPSILSAREVMSIIDKINTVFYLSQDAEITLEANPNDLTKSKILELKTTNINRFSIGVQSFHDLDLQFMKREHSGQEAVESIKNLQDKGWNNISIDLIYGTPTLTNKNWGENISTTIKLDVPHVSAYALTVEKNTELYHKIKSNSCQPIDEEQVKTQFVKLIDVLNKKGFIHYEISNFSKKGYFSKHNSNYWKREKYLGIGPSAHSFNGETRQWNISNNALYILSIQNKNIRFEIEELTEAVCYNEYLLTSLRTIWGVDIDFVKSHFSSFFNDFLMISIKKWIKSGHIYKKMGKINLTEKGKIIADRITSDLFWVE